MRDVGGKFSGFQPVTPAEKSQKMNPRLESPGGAVDPLLSNATHKRFP